MNSPLHDPTGRRTGYLRRLHTERIVTLLRSGPITRAELCSRTGLSRATVSSIVGELLSAGVVVDRPAAEGRREGPGRPTQLVALSEHSVRSVGVAFQLASVSVAIADPLQQLTGTAERLHRQGLNWQDRARIAIEEIHGLYAHHQVEPAQLDGIGVGLTGPVPLTPQNAPWRGAVDTLAREFHAPVYMDNNLRLVVLAETNWGAGQGHDSVLYFHLAEGVGAGIVIEGRLYRGATGAAGELGHVRVAADGPKCRCGDHGCLEQRASLPALLKRAGTKRAGRTLAELAADPALATELDEAAELCGRTVGDALTTLDVGHIVLGGLLAHVRDETVALFTDAVRAHLLPSMRDTLRVSQAHLGNEGAVRGGIALVHHNSPTLEGYQPTRPSPTSPTS